MNSIMARRCLQLSSRRFKDYSIDYSKLIKNNKCVVFMKGTPQQPQCGFSRAVIQMLEVEGADFKEVDSHNILENDVMREELKDFSDWPTFPQVYLAGEFYAGCDIMYEDYQNEKLREILIESGLNLPDINPQE
jgi:monothiol glutaredoxin